ncbi:MAG TPA: NrsF family protein [Gammaproteobacteria bacterium]
MNTDELIDRLATDLRPVTPWRPGRKAAGWLTGAVLYVALLALAMPDRGRTGAADLSFWLPQLAALATGVLAGVAAFASAVPGYPKHVLVWPAVAAVLWLTMLAAGAPWEPGAIVAAHHEWLCVSFILGGGVPLLAASVAMMRGAAPLEPGVTAAFAALAVGALTSLGACLALPHASQAVTLAWHGGAVLVLVTACAPVARFVLGRTRSSLDAGRPSADRPALPR